MPHRVEHRTTRTAASKPDTRTHGEEFREHAGTHGDGVARRCGVDRRLDRREVVRHAEHHAGGVRGITAAGLRYVHAPRHVVRALRDGDRLGVRDHHRERFGACGDDVGLPRQRTFVGEAQERHLAARGPKLGGDRNLEPVRVWRRRLGGHRKPAVRRGGCDGGVARREEERAGENGRAQSHIGLRKEFQQAKQRRGRSRNGLASWA